MTIGKSDSDAARLRAAGYLEPGVVANSDEHGRLVSDHAVMLSIAISLKRIADALDALPSRFRDFIGDDQ